MIPRCLRSEQGGSGSPFRRFRMCGLVLITSAIPALLLSGCNRDDGVCRPEVPAGRIEGRVQCGGLPVSAEIVATRVPDATRLQAVFNTYADDTGQYSLDLPEGPYTLSLIIRGPRYTRYHYKASGLTFYGGAPPDTLVIRPGTSPLLIDFALGGLSVNVDLSRALDGEPGEVRLHARTLDPAGSWLPYIDRGSAEIEGGRLSVRIPGILPDQYRVEVILGYYRYTCSGRQEGEHVWYPGLRASNESPWITISADSLSHLSMSLPVETARIEGRIIGAWLEMGHRERPELALIDADRQTVIRRRLVDADGSFAADLHLSGPVKLRVKQSGIEQWIGGETFEEATVFQLEAGRTVSGVEMVQCGLRCRLVVPGLSPRGITIQFHDPGDLRLLATLSSQHVSGSVVSVPNLWPRDYLIMLSPWRRGEEAWRPQWYDRAAMPQDAQIITLDSPGEVKNLHVTLERGGVLRGTVLMNPDGPACYVIVTPADRMEIWGYVYTSHLSPSFEIQGFPDGDFKIGVCPVPAGVSRGSPAPPAETRWHPGAVEWGAADIVTVANGGDVEGLVLVASP